MPSMDIRRPKLVDPEPITLSLSIIVATAAVVGMIDVIRRARRQEHLDGIDADRNAQQDARAQSAEERQIREEQRQEREEKRAQQRGVLEVLNVKLEGIEIKLDTMKKVLADAERIKDSNRYLMTGRDFQRYRRDALELVSTIPSLTETVIELELTIDPDMARLTGDDLIGDDLDIDEISVLRLIDQTWLSAVVRRAFEDPKTGKMPYEEDPLLSVSKYIQMTRKRLDFLARESVGGGI